MRVLVSIFMVLSLHACDKPQSSGSSETSSGALQAETVPQEIRHLLPIAQKWGIGDDEMRAKYQEKATSNDKNELVKVIAPYRSQINSWLDTYNDGTMPDEAAAFMYTLLGMEEMGI